MAEFVEFLEARKPDGMKPGQYAKLLGVSGAMFHYYRTDQRGSTGIKTDTIQKIAKYFRSQNDTEALSRLASIALGIEGDFTPSN